VYPDQVTDGTPTTTPIVTDATSTGKIWIADGVWTGCTLAADPTILENGDMWCVESGETHRCCYFNGDKYCWTMAVP
jgi:hypothetical protein